MIEGKTKGGGCGYGVGIVLLIYNTSPLMNRRNAASASLPTRMELRAARAPLLSCHLPSLQAEVGVKKDKKKKTINSFKVEIHLASICVVCEVCAD